MVQEFTGIKVVSIKDSLKIHVKMVKDNKRTLTVINTQELTIKVKLMVKANMNGKMDRYIKDNFMKD